jgi:serine protease Do
VRVEALTPEIAERLGTTATESVVVTEVQPGSPAARAGLRPGDLVVEVDGSPVDSSRAFRRAVEGADAGQGLLMRIERNGTSRFIVITPDDN